jgi:hypothetical protein
MEMVSKPCQDRFLHPILVHLNVEKKENIGGQMGHTKKKIFLKALLVKMQISQSLRMIMRVTFTTLF